VAAYEVELTGRARKQYMALDPAIRDRIRRALRDLADDPTPAQVKALTGGGGLLRIRVGAWRVIYQVEHNPLVHRSGTSLTVPTVPGDGPARKGVCRRARRRRGRAPRHPRTSRQKIIYRKVAVRVAVHRRPARFTRVSASCLACGANARELW
jgi:mRNA interferase RelE/StbE